MLVDQSRNKQHAMGQREMLGRDVIESVLACANFFFPGLEPVSKKQ